MRYRDVYTHPFGLDYSWIFFSSEKQHLLIFHWQVLGYLEVHQNLKNGYKEKKKHKKNKHKDRSRKQDTSSCIDKDRMPSRDNEKNGSKKQNHGQDLFLRQQVKVHIVRASFLCYWLDPRKKFSCFSF